MKNSTVSTLLLLLLTGLLAGAGYYTTEVRQPAELQRIDDSEKAARLRVAEVEQLLVEEAATEEMADAAVRKWRARYKYIPEEMKTPDIVEYLESHTTRGFDAFNINLEGVKTTPDFKYYTFSVEGTAYYANLYHFIWHIENNREFYQVRDLSMTHTDVFDENERTGAQRRKDMVKFSLKLDAYFAGVEGLSAAKDELMPVPAQMLPASTPAHNSFYPVVRAELEPNDELLVNVEEAELVSVAGTRAMFEDERGQHMLSEGDAVYLGQIVKVDPARASVRASLNKGGIVAVVDVELDTGQDSFRQARGRENVVPITEQ